MRLDEPGPHGRDDGLETSVDAERGEQAGDVVANRCGTQAELRRDLGRRASFGEQTQNLELPSREVRCAIQSTACPSATATGWVQPLAIMARNTDPGQPEIDETTTESPFPMAILEATLGALPLPAYANDLDGFITWQNEASLALAGDRRGTHYTQAVPPQELKRSKETWAAVTLTGATRRRTGIFSRADGEPLYLEVIAAPLRTNGRVVGVFGLTVPVDAVPREPPDVRLSRRQLDVLRLLVQAKSTNQIAEELHLAPETVRNYIAGLLKALGARNRLEAALIAPRNGLVSLDLD